ncbi:MAG: hypothetical protein IJ846_05585 [Alphaproteobacteria bacterium]|nr:hypothetical protein [Alphaproteobacteria bacterium]
MKRKFSSFFCPLLIFSILTARYFSVAEAFQTGVKLLLPVYVEKIETNSFSSTARIRYHNFIPIKDLIDEAGVIVVRHFEDGRVVFVSKEKGRKLHPREVLLQYIAVPSSLFRKEEQKPDVRFASSELRFSNNRPIEPSAVKYAIVCVNDRGKAFLTGLADNSGTVLVKGLASSRIF